MKRILFLIALFAIYLIPQAQTLGWSRLTDSTVTYSSPRAVDLNGDGVLDIVMGAGKEAAVTNFGILAFDGVSGAPLWTVQTRNEVFTSAQFHDINGDNVPDIFLGGRDAQLYAINGATGAIIWEFWPHANGNWTTDGLYNFYSPQLIPDQDGDNIPDLLVANGGDHAAPVWQTNRPPGHLMIISSVTGAEISRVEVPDGAEIYCSPTVAELRGNGTLYVIFGTGGETLPGSLWVAELDDVKNEDLSAAVALVTHPTLGFIAPAAVGKFTPGNHLDIIAHGYDGTMYRFSGSDFSLVWSRSFPGTETSAAPVIGNFTGNIVPDVFGVLYKGVAPSYSDFYQVMLNGETGALVYKDSLLNLHFAAPVAFDSNGDGRDEVLISGAIHVGHFRHQMMLIDFQNNTSAPFWNDEGGCNIGSTPWVGDLDNDNLLDVVFAFRRDSLNPMGWKGTFVKRLNTTFEMPIKDIAWGSYMGTGYDGHYNYQFTNCGFGSILSNVVQSNPSCNGLSDGKISPVTGNGTGPFTYLWSDGSVGDQLLNVPAGQYTLIVTDATGCSEIRNFTLSDPYVISYGGMQQVTCPGGNNGTVTVSSTGCYCMFSGCNFLWETGQTGYTLTGASSGMYTVTITHLDGCVVVDSVFIPEGGPTLGSAQQMNVSCFGSADGTVILNPNFQGTSYVWDSGESTETINGLDAGTYTVTATDPRGCTQTQSFSITEPDAIQLTSSATQPLCNGDANGEIELSVSGGTAPFLFTFEGNTTGSTLYTGLSAGTYSFSTEDANGCTTSLQTEVLVEPQSISATSSSVPETNLGDNDGTASVMVSGGTAPYSYLWNDNAAQTTSSATGLASGNYEVVVTDANGCTFSTTVFVSHTTSIDEKESVFTVQLSPNPANENVRIELGSQEMMQLEILDLSGRIVLQSTVQQQAIINTSLLSDGSYHVRIGNESMQKVIRLVVVH
jgi:hypothetical protein